MNKEDAILKLLKLVADYGVIAAEYTTAQVKGNYQVCQQKTIDLMAAQTKIVMFANEVFEVKK